MQERAYVIAQAKETNIKKDIKERGCKILKGQLIPLQWCIDNYKELNNRDLFIQNYKTVNKDTIVYDNNPWFNSDSVERDLNIDSLVYWKHINKRENFLFTSINECYISLKLYIELHGIYSSIDKLKNITLIGRNADEQIAVEFYLDSTRLVNVRELPFLHANINTIKVSRNKFEELKLFLNNNPTTCLSDDEFNFFVQNIFISYGDCNTCNSLKTELQQLHSRFKIAAVERDVLKKVVDHTMSQQRMSINRMQFMQNTPIKELEGLHSSDELDPCKVFIMNESNYSGNYINKSATLNESRGNTNRSNVDAQRSGVDVQRSGVDAQRSGVDVQRSVQSKNYGADVRSCGDNNFSISKKSKSNESASLLDILSQNAI